MNTVKLNRYNLANILIQFIDKSGNLVFNNNDSITIDLTDNGSNLYYNHVVSLADTYQTISHRYYGTTRLWWLIAKMNGVMDATILPKPGTVIKVLNENFLELIVSNISKIQQ